MRATTPSQHIGKRMNIEVTPPQLEYIIELTTLDVALSMMKRDKLQTPALKERLNTRIDANRNFLNMLKAKKNEYCEVGSKSDYPHS